MPYKDKEKKRAFQNRYNAKRKIARQTARRKLGHHTTVSIAWPKPRLLKSQCAWVAAVLDCEGTLTVHTPMNKQRNSRNLQIYSRVEMVDDRVPLRLLELCGGSFSPIKLTRNINARARCFWNISSNGLRWLLPQLLPHLIIKLEHAKIMLRILRSNMRGRRRLMTSNDLFSAICRIRELNRRGKKPNLEQMKKNIFTACRFDGWASQPGLSVKT